MQPPRPFMPPGGPMPGAGPMQAGGAPPGKAPYGTPPPGAFLPTGAQQQPGMLAPQPQQQPYGGTAPPANGFGPQPRPMGMAPPAAGGGPGYPRPMGGMPGGVPPQAQQQPPQQQHQQPQQLAAGMAGMSLGPPGGAPRPAAPPGAMQPSAAGMPAGPRPMFGGPPPAGGGGGGMAGGPLSPTAARPQMGVPGALPAANGPPGAAPPRPMGVTPSFAPPAGGPGMARPMGPPPAGGAAGFGPPPGGAPAGFGPAPGGAPAGFGPPPGGAPGGFGPPPPGGFGPRPGMPPLPGGMPPPPGAMQMPPGMPGTGAPRPGFGPPPPPGAFTPGAFAPGAPPPPPGPAPPPPGAPHGAPRQQGMQSRIDPSQIPRPAAVVQGPEPIVYHTRANGAHHNPPPSTARFIVRDCGSASPRLLRSTLNAVPATPDLMSSSGMALGLVVQPMALPDPEDDPVPVVDLGDLGPVRCSRCKAYINAFTRWADGGKAFACNFCGALTPCPEAYFCYLGPDGRRRDADERPELCKGTYEIVATRDYMVRPPMPVTHVFAIDVSGPALASGAAAAACQCVEQVLDSIQGGDAALVGIVTFDSAVHFYEVAPGQGAPSMKVMADTHDVYSPLPPAALSKLADCKEQLVDLLHSIPSMFTPRGPESCGAAAIEACVELLKPVGGKLHAFLASIPNSGARQLKMRDTVALGNEKDKQLNLVPQDNTYHTLATSAADFQVCIDLFLLVQSYTDAATLGVLATTTGGSVYRYCPFAPGLDQDQLLNDLKWNVARPQGLEAILRVRASTGLDVDGYMGAFYKPINSPTDVYLPAVDSDKALIARINVVDKMAPGSECYLQSALLYTSTDGARRIRVSTLALPVSDSMGAIFKGADLDSQLALMARQVAVTLPGNTFAAAKDGVMTSTIASLASYRKFCATSSSAVQLILPEALKLLPLYALALLKSPALRPDVKADDRSAWLAGALSLGAGRIMGMLHGRLFPLHRIFEAGQLPAQGMLPEPLALSSEGLEQGGVYLLENGGDVLIYLDRDVAPPLVQDLFGASGMDELMRAPAPLLLPPRDGPAARLLAELLTRVRLQRCAFMRLRVARKGDPLEGVFLSSLLEDRSPSGMSYVEFLCHVHRQIQNKQA